MKVMTSSLIVGAALAASLGGAVLLATTESASAVPTRPGVSWQTPIKPPASPPNAALSGRGTITLNTITIGPAPKGPIYPCVKHGTTYVC